LTSFVELKLFM